MKQIFKCLFIVSVSIFTMQSCIDKDFDDINKGGVIPIPPIQLSLDPINLGGLDGIVPGNIPLPPGSIAVSDTIDGVFAGDAVKDFFYEGANRVEIGFVIDNGAGKTQISLQNVTIEIHFNVLDDTEEKKTIVSLPVQTLKLNANGKFVDNNGNLLTKVEFKGTFSAEDMPKMQNGANDLEIVVVAISAGGAQISFGPNDKIVFESVLMKTSGMYFEL